MVQQHPARGVQSHQPGRSLIQQGRAIRQGGAQRAVPAPDVEDQPRSGVEEYLADGAYRLAVAKDRLSRIPSR
ncbi:MAG: hypothetical protein H0W37_05570 [Pseudonocardiales bacterium]|jgi:hypothetical protein|nr:hypothetical protein [Pseudonocardiales bacterium]